MNVALLPVPPAFHQALRIFHHRLRVCCYARAMERRLHQSPLPQPEITFAGEQPFSKYVPVSPQDSAFVVPAWMANQYLFNEGRMIDENIFEIDDANADDVAVTRQFGEHFQRTLFQRSERPAFEPGVRAGRKSIAAEPHGSMLSPVSPRVNAGEFCNEKA